MAFKITPKFKPELIKNRSLDTGLFSKYYKDLQDLLINKTGIETTTEYFFCQDFSNGEDLLIMGTQTENHKRVFKAAGKGKEGFDKNKVSMGSCFILNENGRKVLCIQANASLAKAKKAPVLKSLKKMQRAFMKQINEVRWLDAPLMQDAVDATKVEQVSNPERSTDSSSTASEAAEQAPQIPAREIEKKAKDLKKGVDKLNNDVIPRYKKRLATATDAAFVKALRKAGLIFLTNLTQTDGETRKKFSAQVKGLQKSIPQWKKLEAKIHSQKTRNEASAALKQSLKKVVERMNATRTEIKELLKRVDLKTLG